MADYPEGALAVLRLPTADLGENEEVRVLRDDLRAMLNNAECSDIQLVCKDGVRVSACRGLLAARCCVFKSLLTNGMVETKLSEIPLPDITSLALLTTMEFLYTGGILQNQLTLVSAFQTLHASRFLMIGKLETYVMLFLEPAVKEVTDGQLLVWCFTQFAEFSTDWKHVSRTADLVRLMASRLQAMDSYPLNNLSIPAFCLYVTATRSLDPCGISFREYVRLRNILVWAGSRVSLATKELLSECLPSEQYLQQGGFDALRKSSSFSANSDFPPLEPDLKQELRTWIEKVDSGWSTIHLQCIHPELLVKVLEPLDIIPQPLYVSALRYQVLHSGRMNLMMWSTTLSRGSGYEIAESGALLHVSEQPFRNDLLCTVTATAIATMPINHGLCEWDIMIEGSYRYLSIGVTERLSSFSGWSFKPQWSRSLSTQGWLVGGVGGGPPGATAYCNSFDKIRNSRVRVHVDMKLRTCAFTVNGEKHGVAWSDIPHEVFPMVYLQPSAAECKVRIQLVSDPDFM